MSTLNTNKLTFFQNGGAPLVSGYIYIGQPGTDPQVTDNQKTVTFEDSQGNEFEASQPLRTNSDGRVQYNGKAIIATVDGDYSLLILDSSQTQINGGWTPTVSGDSSSDVDTENLREYRLTLAEVKQVDVSQGQTIGNVGNTSADDGGGVDWLVVSNTGESEDNVDLIDFDNGLQGKRLTNITDYTDSGFLISTQYYLANSITAGDTISVLTATTNTTIGPTGSWGRH